MVVPKEGLPAAALVHLVLPVKEKALELHEVEGNLAPLFAVVVVDLEVVEGKDHVDFVVVGAYSYTPNMPTL